MGDLLDELQDMLDSRSTSKGISPADILDLPTPFRRLLRKMLKEQGLGRDEILSYVESWSKEDRLAIVEIEIALASLIAYNWVKLDEVGRYKVIFRPKRSGSLNEDLWGALEGETGDN